MNKPMNQLDPDGTTNEVRALVDRLRHALRRMAGAIREQAMGLGSGAGRRMENVQHRLVDIEHLTVAELQHLGRRTRAYVHDHPWQLAGGLAIAAAALLVLAQTRF